MPCMQRLIRAVCPSSGSPALWRLIPFVHRLAAARSGRFSIRAVQRLEHNGAPRAAKPPSRLDSSGSPAAAKRLASRAAHPLRFLLSGSHPLQQNGLARAANPLQQKRSTRAARRERLTRCQFDAWPRAADPCYHAAWCGSRLCVTSSPCQPSRESSCLLLLFGPRHPVRCLCWCGGTRLTRA